MNMKNIIKTAFICYASFFMTISAMAQTKVAVYVAPNENLDESTLQIIGSELVAGIVSNNEYIALERTKEFLAAIQQEKVQTANDDQLRNIGKQMGVSIVCAANIMPYQNSYYIQARMLNVESATIEATARQTSTLASLDEIVTASEALSQKLMTQVKEKQKEKAVATEQERIRQQELAEQRAREEAERRQKEHEEFEAINEQLSESLDGLANSIISLVQTVNSYYLDIYNTKNYPCKVVLDGHELGIVNPYKSQRYNLPIEWYGKLQVTQMSGYLFYPTVYNYKIPKQAKSARITVHIK